MSLPGMEMAAAWDGVLPRETARPPKTASSTAMMSLFIEIYS
jgi:hypothetical protein